MHFNPTPIPQIKPITFPDVRRHCYEDQDIILHSFYFKKLGASQHLNYGDWYAVADEETNRVLCKVYHKNDLDTMESFDFLSKSNYVRLISQDEALNIMNRLGFIYNVDSMDPAIGVSPMGGWYVDMHHPIYGLNFKVEANNVHTAHLKAAYTIFLYVKQTQDFTIDLNNQGFLPEEIIEQGDDDEDE